MALHLYKVHSPTLCIPLDIIILLFRYTELLERQDKLSTSEHQLKAHKEKLEVEGLATTAELKWLQERCAYLEGENKDAQMRIDLACQRKDIENRVSATASRSWVGILLNRLVV